MPIPKQKIISFLPYLFLLGLSGFAFFEVYREMQYPKAEEIKTVSGQLQAVEHNKNQTLFYLSADSVHAFATSGEVQSILQRETIDPFSSGDTFTIGYIVSAPGEIITLAKNNQPLITYLDYENQRWEDIKYGPLAAGITFLGITVLLLFIAYLLPGLLENELEKIRKRILAVEGMTETGEREYALQFRGHYIPVFHRFNFTVSKHGNFNHLEAYIPVPDKHIQRYRVTKDFQQLNGEWYVVVKQQMPLGLNKTKFLRKIEQKIMEVG